MTREYRTIVRPLPGSDSRLWDVIVETRGKKWTAVFTALSIPRSDLASQVNNAAGVVVAHGGLSR